jgi:hypothetical protein
MHSPLSVCGRASHPGHRSSSGAVFATGQSWRARHQKADRAGEASGPSCLRRPERLGIASELRQLVEEHDPVEPHCWGISPEVGRGPYQGARESRSAIARASTGPRTMATFSPEKVEELELALLRTSGSRHPPGYGSMPTSAATTQRLIHIPLDQARIDRKGVPEALIPSLLLPFSSGLGRDVPPGDRVQLICTWRVGDLFGKVFTIEVEPTAELVFLQALHDLRPLSRVVGRSGPEVTRTR